MGKVDGLGQFERCHLEASRLSALTSTHFAVASIVTFLALPTQPTVSSCVSAALVATVMPADLYPYLMPQHT